MADFFQSQDKMTMAQRDLGQFLNLMAGEEAMPLARLRGICKNLGLVPGAADQAAEKISNYFNAGVQHAAFLSKENFRQDEKQMHNNAMIMAGAKLATDPQYAQVRDAAVELSEFGARTLVKMEGLMDSGDIQVSEDSLQVRITPAGFEALFCDGDLETIIARRDRSGDKQWTNIDSLTHSLKTLGESVAIRERMGGEEPLFDETTSPGMEELEKDFLAAEARGRSGPLKNSGPGF